MADHSNERHHSPDDVRSGAPVERSVGSEAIKWGAVVIIVLAILWFLAQYVIPLFG